MADERDWSGFAVIGAQWEWSDAAATIPIAWKVIDPGMVGTQAERDLRYNAWLAEKDTPGYTNERAIAQGWPLRDRATASRIQRRRYDRSVYWIGRVVRDRLLAAPLAPGEFPDVDTSVDPPQYRPVSVQPSTIPATAPIPAPILPAESAESAPRDVPQVPPVRTEAVARVRRLPRVGERVLVQAFDGMDERFVEGTVDATAFDAYGDPTLVNIGGAWQRVTGYITPPPAT